MQSRSRSSSVEAAPAFASSAAKFMAAAGMPHKGGAERKSTFVNRSRSNSAGEDKSAGSDLIAAYSLGLVEEVFLKQIPRHASVATLKRRNTRSASVGDSGLDGAVISPRLKANHSHSGSGATSKCTSPQSCDDSPSLLSAANLYAHARNDSHIPMLFFGDGKDSGGAGVWSRTGRNSRASTEPSIGNLPRYFRTTSASSDDSLDSASSTVGLSPRLLQLSHQMSRAYFLEFILHDKKARAAFKKYLEKRHCVENLMFWLDVERFKKLVHKNKDGSLSKEVNAKVAEIREKYLQPTSDHEVNLTHQDRKELAEALKQPSEHSFDRAQKAIFILMVDGTFDYFLKSDSYKQMNTDDDSPVKANRPAPAEEVPLTPRSVREHHSSKEEQEAAKKRRSLFARRNTDASQPSDSMSSSGEVELLGDREGGEHNGSNNGKKKGKASASKEKRRRHTVTDTKEAIISREAGDSKKCILM